MCSRPKGLIEDAQQAGVKMRATFCGACPYRHDCHYLDQVDTIARHEGRRIVIVTHAMAYLPLPFAPDLIVSDEDVATKAVSVTEIGPARLLDGEKWEGAEGLGQVARQVADALARQGGELAALREAGVTAGHLKACADHLLALHQGMVDAIREAGKGGASDHTLSNMVLKLKMDELRALAHLFTNLAREIETDRPGTNATRLDTRPKKVTDADGTERWERQDRYVISRIKRPSFGKKKHETVLLDGTADLGLVRARLRRGRARVPLRPAAAGAAVQVTGADARQARAALRPPGREEPRRPGADARRAGRAARRLAPGRLHEGAEEDARGRGRA